MLDKPEKTYQFLAVLKAAVPFDVELTPPLIAHLQAQHVAVAVKTREIVSPKRATKAASSAISFPMSNPPM
jgi:hypothetical protein